MPYLTNERLKFKFASFFDLVNYGIKIAQEKMLREEDVTLSSILKELENLSDYMQKKQA